MSHSAPPLSAIRMSSVSGLGVELLTDVVDDLGHKFVEAVKLVHEEGVLLVGVRGDVLQLVLGCPGDADGVGDHTWKHRRGQQIVTHTKHTLQETSLWTDTHQRKQLFV